MLGYRGGPLHWTRNPSGGIAIEVPDAAIRAANHVWTFKVTWRR
ncbi:hypothetical protein [Actinoplanes subtropicus]|nr:hypothetical protein [Actinoplanes subtropicus]